MEDSVARVIYGGYYRFYIDIQHPVASLTTTTSVRMYVCMCGINKRLIERDLIVVVVVVVVVSFKFIV